ncbi:hypothetical protein DPMN_033052 [Dreissena polymorpha]|uniref:Ras-associating and dilute domain-containing protein n=2 Tax=Dreissena polymorpha TaxID=45954 RepID=A0A9D4RIU8_DREPO|nr:hypothetical protein DPMN_033052 [Dreissena polymorpha]
MVRSDWKRHSMPYDTTFEPPASKISSVDKMLDEAMEAFTSGQTGYGTNQPVPRMRGGQKTCTMGRDRKKCISMIKPDGFELSTDEYTPGVLKVFGESICAGVQYKSVLASCRSTAQELVKQALERFGLPASDYRYYVLCDVVGRYDLSAEDLDRSEDRLEKWERVFSRVLADRDKPLLLQKFWKPIENFGRRYELRRRDDVMDLTDDDDTSGINENARKILISKLRPGAIPLFDATTLARDNTALRLDFKRQERAVPTEGLDQRRMEKSATLKTSSEETNGVIPTKHPFFVNIRGFDVKRDKLVYVIKSKRFTFGNPNLKSHKSKDEYLRFNLFAPDINGVHCCFKVYKLKRSNGATDNVIDRNNYFLELTPLAHNICVNGRNISGKIVVKSGDVLNIGLYYVFLFKDCSKGFDIPLSLPWLDVPETVDTRENGIDGGDMCAPCDEESTSGTESADTSMSERMSLAYQSDKEEELVKYICAIIQQQNTCKTYPLTVAFLFSMCIEHASRKFELRQLKHLFLRILFTIRENVAETAKSLSAGKFSCALLDVSSAATDRDHKLERLLLWISNCVQLLLFLKHTFQLPEMDTVSERGATKGRQNDRKSKKEENAKHALGQLVTGLEEIIMFCFQQSVYTITKALHPVLPALLNSNPFSDANSEQCSMEDVVRMLDTLAEVTHEAMLHESITRQLFTYIFFFTNTNLFNKLVVEESGTQYYQWQSGVRVRANLGQLEDWATRNGLEDEFGQMFERLLAVTELLATSKNTLVKYHWTMMKTHYQPLTSSQLYHMITHYQLGRHMPAIWAPSPEEMDEIRSQDISHLPLSSHPPFALPDNCGLVDLVRTPEDASFWNTLRRLKSLYGSSEDDSDSGFSISNTPRCSSSATNGESSYNQEWIATNGNKDNTDDQDQTYATIQKTRLRIPAKDGLTQWVAKPGTGVCSCAEHTESDDLEHTSLAHDLLMDERRETLETADLYRALHDVKDNSVLKQKSLSQLKASLNVKSIINKSETKEINTPSRYLKNGQVSGNVADCSARTLPRSLQIKYRNLSSGLKAKQLQKRFKQGQSFSVEDLPTQMLTHRPHASFEEAIERGYTSDTPNKNSESISEEESSPTNTSSTSDCNSPNVTIKAPRTPRNGIIRRHKSLVTSVTSSVFSDDVFVDNAKTDSSFQGHHSLPIKFSTFKPISTSEQADSKLSKHRSNLHKLTEVSFDKSTRRSSIELTRDDLYFNHADDTLEQTICSVNVRKSADEDDIGSDDDEASFEDGQELFPGELFTEVNEKTLSAMKRHGSSLNVAPSCENSPNLFAHKSYEKVSEIIGVDENSRRMSPCPMYTVYLQKQDGGLGLALIDGLHTSLRLAGIYIRRIQPDSPAARNGCLQVGDRILAVDGASVIGADYQRTMNMILDAGDTLTLMIARGNESMATKVSVSQV